MEVWESVSALWEAPLADAVVFGVHIGGHLVVEAVLAVVIIVLLFQNSYQPARRPLTEKEIDQLCEEWVPEPLHPPITEEMTLGHPVLESAAGPHTVVKGRNVINLSTTNYLGVVGHDKIRDSCTAALLKYGVGSCGPRGFYGTIDVHLDLEAKIASFMGTPDSILYSFGLATPASAIPAFCKRGDLILADEGVHWGIQNGLQLSRSTVKLFRHNDMSSLEALLKDVHKEDQRKKRPLNRRFIVVEAIYQNSGKMASLDEIVRLKEKYRFRVFVDESNSIGVLGKSGRGLSEHFNIPIERVDIITAAMGCALGSAGGFCTGSAKVVDHQRLSGAGYCFSASLPPYIASASIAAIEVLEENPDLLTKLHHNVALFNQCLAEVPGIVVGSHSLSPVVFVHLRDSLGSHRADTAFLQKIVDQMFEESVLMAVAKRTQLDDCKLPAGIRICISAGHSESDLRSAAASLKKVMRSVIADYNLALAFSGCFDGSVRMEDHSVVDGAVDRSPDELDGFKDFTVASSWERLIAAVESVCREWYSVGREQLLSGSARAVEGLSNLYHVHAEVSQGFKKYRLELFFADVKEHEANGNSYEDWQSGLHMLQLRFGVKDFMVIAPVSLSGVLLDPPEATILLSSVSVALSNCGSMWPVFVPVHDPTRRAYMGIESATKSSSVKFEADRLGSQVPVRLMHLEGLYDLFTSKLKGSHSAEDSPRVGFTMRLTYEGSDLAQNLSGGSPRAEQTEELDAELAENILWDDDFPWAEWHSVEDPIKAFELIAIWRNRYVSSPVDLAEFENASTFEADRWMLKPVSSREDEQKGESMGFTGRLRGLVQSFVLSKEAEFMEDFVTVVKPSIENLTRYFKVPPPTVLDRVLKDIFFQAPQASRYDSKGGRLVKGAPPDSLFGRFCLHGLWFGDCNIRAIAVLWVEFVREVRWCWEELQPLPRCSADEVPNLATCLIHQKLQLLATCINQKILRKSSEKRQDTIDSDIEAPSAFKKSKRDTLDATRSMNDLSRMETLDNQTEAMDTDNAFSFDDEKRRGSAGPVDNLTLSWSNRPLHAPITQAPPIMTEDMLQEREQALAALDKSPTGEAARIRLQSDILASDMAAFKAANPGAVLEDFVKWHSPRDWVEDSDSDEDTQMISKQEAHARGRLSKRMAEPGNAWGQIWESVQGIPASEQKPLFDYMREGEKVIHYLDTLRPYQLLAQMLCTAFVAATDVLWKTPGCTLEPVASQFDELYSIMAVVLAPLSDRQVQNQLDDLERNLMQICTTFEKVEVAVALAASLSQKLPEAPTRLLNALSECKKEHHVALTSYKERDLIADTIFSPQNVSQTWKESLRMGNFLNGHEPVSREVIFTFYESEVNGYGEASKERRKQVARRLYSHRMYICGTSDDLQIAMSSGSED